MEHRKKLIEVALPIPAINEESERDKKLSSGHPTTLHYWWAPRPLPACRAMAFASVVDDPSAHPDRFPDEASQQAERERLFALIERLILWESRFDNDVLEQAREEIARSTDDDPPTVLDPFCGRGLIPLEAQRLGMDVMAGDLNPVACLIAKVLLEIVPTFVGKAPVHPREEEDQHAMAGEAQWGSAQGFSEDASYYATEVLERAASELRPVFPEYLITPELAADRPDLEELVDERLQVMGWLWARTVVCSNPSCRSTIPLVGSFWLSKKKGKKAWLEPITDEGSERVRFHVVQGNGTAPDPTKIPRTGGSFRCLVCDEISDENHLWDEGTAGRIGQQLMACIVDGGRGRGRIYLPATKEHEHAALHTTPDAPPEYPLPESSQGMPTIRHGVRTWADLFTDRQMVAIEALADAIHGLHSQIEKDARQAEYPKDDRALDAGGRGARAYADAITGFLGLVLGKYVNRSCNFCFWDSGYEKIQQPFAQQGIQKTWDFVETNPFSGASGSWESAMDYPLRVIREVAPSITPGRVAQQPAEAFGSSGSNFLVLTDPPYYDNIPYADLSDFFYVWMRRALRDVFPDMFGTILTPKEQELTALRHRFDGDKDRAEASFVEGMTRTFQELARIQSDEYPLCLFYAYKQKETREGEVEVSTGWETMLVGLIEAGFMVVGTWPILSESIDTIKKGKSFLSTSVVLVCRKRPVGAGMATRRQFIDELKRDLPLAIRNIQAGNIAPVDLAQAAIGPGMAVFSRYSKVVESDGSPMEVRTALQLVNEILDETLSEQEADFDPDTRWAVAWYQQYGMDDGPYGVAESLATAKNISIPGLEEAGIVVSRGGRVRLLGRDELDGGWDPVTDSRLTVWEVVQHLTQRLQNEGEAEAAALLKRLGGVGEVARELAYQLFSAAERTKRAEEALAYNSLVVSWPELRKLAGESAAGAPTQTELL